MNVRHQHGAVRTRRRQRGALLVDVMLGMLFLMFATLTLMSLFPVVKKGEQMSTEQSKAVQMCDRLLEHVQMLGAKNINGQNLTALNLIDAGQAAQPYKFTHIPLDEASRYSPAQVLRGADGSLTYTTINGNAVKVLVTLSYVSDTGTKQTIQTGTIVGAYR